MEHNRWWPNASAEAYAEAVASLPKNEADNPFVTSAEQARAVFGEATWLVRCFDDGAADVTIAVIGGHTTYTAFAKPNTPTWVARAYYPPRR